MDGLMPVRETRSTGAVIRNALTVLAVMAMVAVCCVPRTEADSTVQTITVHAVRYEFDPAEITVERGQTVRLVFIADDVAHGVAINELGVDVDLPKHKAQTVTITPTAVGDFEGECSKYCGSGHSGMTFVVHVRQ
jgi:cytochrome c oxidase subunit 2